MCDALIARGAPLPWAAYVTPAGLDEPFAETMAKARCAGVELGTDSGSDAMLKRLRKPFGLAQVKKAQTDRFVWTDRDGKSVVAQDVADKLEAPNWFAVLARIETAPQSVEVTAGGVGYGTLSAWMTPIKSYNRLWAQFVKQLQIVAVTLFLMLQFIWLIFRGNLGTLRMLAEGANRFSLGEHAVRIDAEGAPEVQLAAEAFNNMANNTERLIASLGESESKNKLLATIVEQSSEAIWTRNLRGNVTSWNSGAAAMFGYRPDEVIGHALNVGGSTPGEEEGRMRRIVARCATSRPIPSAWRSLGSGPTTRTSSVRLCKVSSQRSGPKLRTPVMPKRAPEETTLSSRYLSAMCGPSIFTPSASRNSSAPPTWSIWPCVIQIFSTLTPVGLIAS